MSQRDEKNLDYSVRNLREKIVETLQEGLGIVDADETFIFLNDKYCEILGLSREELLGMKITDLLPEDEIDHILAETRKRNKGRSSRYETRMRHKSGELRDIRTSVSPLFNDQGEYFGAVGLILDITDQKKTDEELRRTHEQLEDLGKKRTEKLALTNEELRRQIEERERVEKNLRRSEIKYRRLFSNVPVGVFQTTPGGQILSANQALVKMLGYKSEEELCLKKKVQDLYEDPGKRAEWIRALNEAGEFRNRELVLKKKNGERIVVSEHARVVWDDEGKVSHYEGILADVSEIKLSQEALRESEEKFRNLVERTADGITILQDNRLVYVNPHLASVLGYKVEEITDTEFSQYIHPNELPKVGDRYKRRMKGEKVPPIYETVLIHKKGWPVHVELNAEIIPFRGQNADLVTVRDITSRRRVEEERQRLQTQIQHAQKLESLGVLSGGIAHDFNNLLMGILGNASLALKNVAPDSEVEQYIEKIEKSAQRAAELTNQLLAYSGKGKFVVQPVNVTDLVRDMAELLRVTISKKVALRYNFAKSLPPIEADVSQIRQVMMNLISNASEAIGDKPGTVSVYTGAMGVDRAYLAETYLNEDLPEGTYVFLEVGDDGVGMDTKTLEKIFDPFFTTKFQGRGLGLAAVLGIVRGHKGGIKVYSEPGKGTNVKVIFPATKAEKIKTTKKISKQPTLLREKTILVVDDEDTVLEVVKEMLASLEMKVITAENGRVGVDLFKRHAGDIDLVLLDTTMPEMNGEEVFRALRKLQPDVNVVLSSGYNEQEATSHFVGKGLAGFIQKPYTIDKLITKLDEALRRQSK